MNVSFERLLGPGRCFLMLMYDNRKTPYVQDFARGQQCVLL